LELSIPELYEQAAFLIPEGKTPAPQALTKSYTLRHVTQLGQVFQAILQMIVRNTAAHMVNMVEPDIAAEPSEDSRELKIRAAFQCC
jgi:hypothetical protein